MEHRKTTVVADEYTLHNTVVDQDHKWFSD